MHAPASPSPCSGCCPISARCCPSGPGCCPNLEGVVSMRMSLGGSGRISLTGVTPSQAGHPHRPGATPRRHPWFSLLSPPPPTCFPEVTDRLDPFPTSPRQRRATGSRPPRSAPGFVNSSVTPVSRGGCWPGRRVSLPALCRHCCVVKRVVRFSRCVGWTRIDCCALTTADCTAWPQSPRRASPCDCSRGLWVWRDSHQTRSAASSAATRGRFEC